MTLVPSGGCLLVPKQQTVSRFLNASLALGDKTIRPAAPVSTEIRRHSPRDLIADPSHLVVEVQHVGAVSPLGEDDGVLLLPLQTATLGPLVGLRGGVVLETETSCKTSEPTSSQGPKTRGQRHCCPIPDRSMQTSRFNVDPHPLTVPGPVGGVTEGHGGRQWFSSEEDGCSHHIMGTEGSPLEGRAPPIMPGPATRGNRGCDGEQDFMFLPSAAPTRTWTRQRCRSRAGPARPRA